MLALLASIVAAPAVHGDIRSMLRDQGFSGPLNGRETIEYIGHIRDAGADYRIYSYYGAFRAAAVDHGVSRLIVMRNGSTFFGEYAVAMPVSCKVRARKVICSAGTIEFTKRGPPEKILFDGEVVAIQLGGKAK